MSEYALGVYEVDSEDAVVELRDVPWCGAGVFRNSGAYERSYVDSLVPSRPELMMNRSTAMLIAFERIDS